MSDYSIGSISSVRPAEAGSSLPLTGPVMPGAVLNGAGLAETAAPRMGAPAQPDAAAAARTIAAKEAATNQADPAAPKAGAPAEPKPARPEDKPVLPVNNGDSVSIHFRVDAKTRNVTVFIVDKESKRVLRSIPPEELGKLQAGDLLEFTA
jgi:hypothetical protein